MKQIGPARSEAFKPREHLLGVKLQCGHCVARYEITADDLTEHPRKVFVSRIQPDSAKPATGELFEIRMTCPNCGVETRNTRSREDLEKKSRPASA